MNLDQAILRAAAFLLLATSFCFGEEMREWTDATGKFKVNATLEAHDKTTATLRREDGKKLVMPLEKLSEADRKYVKSRDVNPFEALLAEGDEEVVEKPLAHDDPPEKTTTSKPSSARSKPARTAPSNPNRTSPPRVPMPNARSNNPNAPFTISGKTHHFADCDRTVYIGEAGPGLLPRQATSALGTTQEISAPKLKEWNVRPEIVKRDEDPELRSVSMKSDDPNSARIGAVVPFKRDGSSKVFCVSGSGNAKEKRRSRLGLCNVGDGTARISEESLYESSVTDVSPSGKYALSYASLVIDSSKGVPDLPEPGFLAITSLAEVGKSDVIEPEGIFCPYFAVSRDVFSTSGSLRVTPGHIKCAYWINETTLLTATSQGTASLWDLNGCLETTRVPIEKSCGVALSPTRNLFAATTSRGARIYDAKTLELLGYHSFYEEEKESRYVDGASCSFSPSGDKLAVCTRSEFIVIDLATGSEELRRPFKALDIGTPIWAAPNYFIIAGVGYDLDKGAPICNYSGMTFSKTCPTFFGRVWGVVDNVLVGAKLPSEKERDAIETFDFSKSFAIYPGLAMSIKTDVNGLLDEEEVVEKMKGKLKAYGFKYDAAAPTQLVATCCDTGQTENVAFVVSRNDFGFVPHRDYTEEDYKSGKVVVVKMKIFELKISVVSGSETYYESPSTLTDGFRGEKRDESISVAEQAHRGNKPNVRPYDFMQLPQYVGRSGTKATAISARICDDGSVL